MINHLTDLCILNGSHYCYDASDTATISTLFCSNIMCCIYLCLFHCDQNVWNDIGNDTIFWKIIVPSQQRSGTTHLCLIHPRGLGSQTWWFGRIWLPLTRRLGPPQGGVWSGHPPHWAGWWNPYGSALWNQILDNFASDSCQFMQWLFWGYVSICIISKCS